jgi:hypothetical protein
LKASASNISRILHEGSGPEWLRPPPGDYADSHDRIGVRLTDTETRQSYLQEVFEAVQESKSEREVVVVGWLSLDDPGGRNHAVIKVNVATKAVGEISDQQFWKVAEAVRKEQSRSKTLWIDVFIAREGKRYIPEAALPAL